MDLAAANESWVASDLRNLGDAVKDRGADGALLARSYYSQALAISERLSPSSLENARSLTGLGNIADDLGDLPAAPGYYGRALAIRDRLAPNSLDVAKSLNGLGNVADERGDLPAAEQYYRRSLDIRERLAPNSRDVAGSLSNLGNLAREVGDLRKSEGYLNRSLAIRQRLAPNSLDVAISLNNIGGVAFKRGDLDEANEYFSRSLEIDARLIPHSRAIGSALFNLGVVAMERGDFRVAQDYMDRALTVQEQVSSNSIDLAMSLGGRGFVANGRGEFEAGAKLLPPRFIHSRASEPREWKTAKDYYLQAFQIQARLAPDSVEAAETLTNLGKLAFKERRFSDARSFFSRATTIIESQRGHIPSGEARAYLVARYRPAYEGLVQSFVALNDLPAAFATSERASGRSLLDFLAESRVDIRQDVEPALLAREHHLQESLNANAERQTSLLSGQRTEQEAAAAAKDINEITSEYHAVQAAIRTSSPHHAALTQPQPFSLQELQRQVLDKDSLLLEYSFGEEASVPFAVTQSSLKIYHLPKRAEIEALAVQNYKILTARNLHPKTETTQQRRVRFLQAEANYPKLAARLSRMILAPAASELGTKRLLIVGDGTLMQIPFAVLTDPAANKPQPLLINHEIVSLPSASVMAMQRKELATRKHAARQLAIFADPVFERDDERVTAVLQDAKSRRETGNRKAMRDISPERAGNDAGIRDGISTIQRLPFSREEATTIFAFAQQNNTLKALGFDANKKTATSGELSGYRIVHFATHALLNGDHPELTGIVL